MCVLWLHFGSFPKNTMTLDTGLCLLGVGFLLYCLVRPSSSESNWSQGVLSKPPEKSLSQAWKALSLFERTIIVTFYGGCAALLLALMIQRLF